MGLYDRDYTQADFRSRFHNAPQMRMTFPQVTPAVKWLLIINTAVYFLQILGAEKVLMEWFSLYPVSLLAALQLWRLVTYQFLHGGVFHIFFNMLGLFFLGQIWRVAESICIKGGTRKVCQLMESLDIEIKSLGKSVQERGGFYQLPIRNSVKMQVGSILIIADAIKKR